MTETKKDAPFPTEWDEDIGETDPLESRAFYEYMQAYRHSRSGGLEFKEVKTWLRSLTAHSTGVAEPVITGWPPSALMQDDDRGLSKALSNTPHARLNAREAAQAIAAPAVQSEPIRAALLSLSHALDDDAASITERQAYHYATSIRKLIGIDGPEATKEFAAALAQPVVPTPATAQPAETSDILASIESPFNACMHREHCKEWKKAAQPVPVAAMTSEQIEALRTIGQSVFANASQDASDAIEWMCSMLRVQFDAKNGIPAPGAMRGAE